MIIRRGWPPFRHQKSLDSGKSTGFLLFLTTKSPSFSGCSCAVMRCSHVASGDSMRQPASFPDHTEASGANQHRGLLSRFRDDAWAVRFVLKSKSTRNRRDDGSTACVARMILSRRQSDRVIHHKWGMRFVASAFGTSMKQVETRIRPSQETGRCLRVSADACLFSNETALVDFSVHRSWSWLLAVRGFGR